MLQFPNPFNPFAMPFPQYSSPQANPTRRKARDDDDEDDSEDEESRTNEERSMMLLLLQKQQQALQKVTSKVQEYKNPRLHQETQRILNQLQELQNAVGPTQLISEKAMEKFSSTDQSEASFAN